MILNYIILNYSVLYYIMLYYVILCYIILYYIICIIHTRLVFDTPNRTDNCKEATLHNFSPFGQHSRMSSGVKGGLKRICESPAKLLES